MSETFNIRWDESCHLESAGQKSMVLSLSPRYGVAGLIEPGSGHLRKSLTISGFLFAWKTTVAVSPLGETERLSEIPVRRLMKSLFSRNRENGKNVKIGLPFTKIRVFTTT